MTPIPWVQTWPECEMQAGEKRMVVPAFTVVIGILLCGLMLIFSCRPAHAETISSKSTKWSDEAIVNAIYKAEGGARADYPYGIKSIKCQTESQCREICKGTVRKNRYRYSKKFGKRPDGQSYLVFLAGHYCPTNGHLSKAEKELNKNWLKNVTYFLRKEAA